MPNLNFLAATVPQIWRGSQNSKSRSHDPFMTDPFDLILHFFNNTPCNQPVCEIWHEYLHQWPIYGCFTTAPIWPRNAYSRPFWGGFLGVWPPKCSRILWPQKAHSWPETRILAYRSCRWVKKCDLGTRWRKQKKKRNSEMWQVTYLPRPPTLCYPMHYPYQSCCAGAVPDVVNHAKLKSVRGFGSLTGRKLPFSYA